MTAAKKQKMAGFYGLSDGSTLYVGDANNPRLPKGKTGSVFYTVFGKDGKLKGSGTVDYGQKGFEEIKSSVSKDTGKSVGGLIAGEGTQQYKDLRNAMSKPDRLIGLLKGTGTAQGATTKGKKVQGDQPKPEVAQKGGKVAKNGNDAPTTKGKKADSGPKKPVAATPKGKVKEQPESKPKSVTTPTKGKETTAPKKVNGNYQGFKEPNGYFKVLMDGPTCGTSWTYDNPITGVKATVYFINKKFSSLTYGTMTNRDNIYKGQPFKNLDDVNQFLLDYSRQEREKKKAQDKDKFNHLKAKNVKTTANQYEWTYYDKENRVTSNIRYDAKNDVFKFTHPATNETVQMKGSLKEVADQIDYYVRELKKKEAQTKQKKDDFAKDNPISAKYADRLTHSTVPYTFDYYNEVTGVRGTIEYDHAKTKKYNAFGSTTGSRFKFDKMKMGFGTVDSAVAYLDSLKAPKGSAPAKKGTKTATDNRFAIPKGSHITKAYEGYWDYDNEDTKMSGNIQYDRPNDTLILTYWPFDEPKKAHTMTFVHGSLKDVEDFMAAQKKRAPTRSKSGAVRYAIPSGSGIHQVSLTPGKELWRFEKQKYKLRIDIMPYSDGLMMVGYVNGKKDELMERYGFKDLFEIDTYIKEILAEFDAAANQPTGKKTKPTSLDDTPKRAQTKAQGKIRRKTDYQLKNNDVIQIYAGGAFMIPSGRYRWISSPDFDGRAQLEIIYDEAKGKYVLSGHLGKKVVGPLYYDQGYDAEGAAYERYKDYIIANGLTTKMPDRFVRPESKKKELEHFVPDPKGRKSILGDPYMPVDDRHGKFKPRELYLSDHGYDISWDKKDPTMEGQGGPATSLKDAENQLIKAVDRRYVPSEYKLMPSPNRGKNGEKYTGCPNCGSILIHGYTGGKESLPLAQCDSCGCVWDWDNNVILMELWDHKKFNEFRDGAERARTALFPNGYRWTPWKEDGEEYGMTRDNFDERFYNVFYDPNQQKYDRRTRDFMNFNKKPKGQMLKNKLMKKV